MSDQNPEGADPNYPKYPGGGSPGGSAPPPPPTGPPPASSVPEQPASIGNAVKLMYAGAALSLLSVILTFFMLDTLKDITAEAARDADPNASQSTIDAAYTLGITFAVVVGLIGVGLWLWMAWKNGQGRSWARIVATVFGVLNVISLLVSFIQPSPPVSRIVGVVSALLGVVILVLLWKKESSDYYKAVTQSKMLR